MRVTAASMLPASLRAGIMTETVAVARGTDFGRGRATRKTVRQQDGSTGASQRLQIGSSTGTASGNRMRPWVLMTCQSASSHRFHTSRWLSQLLWGERGLKPRAVTSPSMGRHREL